MMKARTAVWVLAASFALGVTGLRAADTTMTGRVTDTMCGATHSAKGKTDAECVADCIKMGDDFAIVVKDAGKDKVITLTSVSDANKAALLKLAGKDAKVTGTVTGDKMTVTKVEAVPVIK
jgi:hypothetical protein